MNKTASDAATRLTSDEVRRQRVGRHSARQHNFDQRKLRTAAYDPSRANRRKGRNPGLHEGCRACRDKTDTGAAVLGTGGDEAIQGLLDTANAGLPYDVLQRAVPIHPTVSELIPTLLGDLSPPNSV